MIVPANRRVSEVASVRNLTATRYFGAAGGPQGSTTMMFATVFMLTRPLTAADMFNPFGGNNISLGVGGWSIRGATSVGILIVAVSGGGVVTPHQATAGTFFDIAGNVGVPMVVIGQVVGGQITASLTGRTDTAATPIVGYTVKPAGQMTSIGTDDSIVSGTRGYEVSECIFFNGYDGTGFASATFGAGLAGINAMWCEDLQQGRVLTPPTAPVANSAWYWSARDIVGASGTVGSSWVDRYSSFALARVGAPQASAIIPRF